MFVHPRTDELFAFDRHRAQARDIVVRSSFIGRICRPFANNFLEDAIVRRNNRRVGVHGIHRLLLVHDVSSSRVMFCDVQTVM